MFKIYIADTLYYKSQNKCIDVRYYDLLNKKHDYRTADEIAADVIKAAGLVVNK